MERAVHAAEEILSSARAGKRALTPALVGDCLACLDQVVQWLDVMEQTGELPSNRSRVRRSVKPGWRTCWIATPTCAHGSLRRCSSSPTPDCFYQGEDPLARITSLPELLALDFEPVVAWPSLDSLDPYKCNLVLTALTAASISEVTGAHAGPLRDLRNTGGRFSSNRDAGPHSALAGPRNPERAAGTARPRYARHSRRLRRFRGFDRGKRAARLLLDRTPPRSWRRQPRKVSRKFRRSLCGFPWRSCCRSTPAVTDIAKPSVKPGTAAQTLRIEAARVDALVRLTGELTVAKNAAAHVAKLAQEEGNSLAGLLKERHGVLNRLIAELQDSVLAMRVLPLRSVLQRFPRVVREMSANLGKPLKLEIEGDDTEADKAIVEMLFEPLLHIVRNAIDHGIESPGERAARGKPSTARIRIRAARQGDQVLHRNQRRRRRHRCRACPRGGESPGHRD